MIKKNKKLFIILYLLNNMAYGHSSNNLDIQGIIEWIPISSVAKIIWKKEFEKPYIGQFLTSFREYSDQKILIPTGNLKVLSIKNNEVIASIEKNEQEVKSYFPDFPFVMAHDVIKIPKLNVIKNQHILPFVVLSYKEIFLEPDKGSQNFQISSSGKEILKKSLDPFFKKKFHRILISSFTGIEGSFEENQTESYQRSMSIQDVLIQDFRVSEDRIISVGQGENDPIDKTGFGDSRNRRITIEFF